MQEELVKEVKKMNSFLEAIDWKLWEIYKKMGADGSVHATTAPSPAQVPAAQTEQVLAPVIAPTPVVAPVVPVPSYPNIEKWK
jgi:hypothetical protein